MMITHNRLHKKLLSLALAMSLALSLTIPASAFEVEINSDWEGNIYGNEIYYLGNGTGTISIPATYTNEAGEKAYVHYALGKFDRNTKTTKVSTNAPLYKYPYFNGCTSLTSVEIPSTVRILYSNFADCSALTTVNFINMSDPDPDSESPGSDLIKIEQQAFMRCTSLESISIPDTVHTIEHSAFWECSSLSNIHFPKSLTKIGSYAFVLCSSLRSVSLPSSLETINDYAFEQCSLESVTIPASVTKIYKKAFANNPNLNSITFQSNDSAKTLATMGDKEYFSYDPFEINGVDNSTRTIFGPAGGYVEKFAKHWGYCFNSAPAAEEGFTFGVDTYSFANSTKSFSSSKNAYEVSDEQLAMLTDGYPKSFIAELKENMNKPFYGMCFGMTTTAALFYTGELSQSKVQPGASTTYSLSAPSSNESLRELLAFYQLSQFQQTLPAYSISNETPNNLALVNALKAGSDPVVFVGTLRDNTTFSHAMIAYDIDEAENGYEIKVYDPNRPSAPIVLCISKDGKTSDFKDTYSSVFIKESMTKSEYTNSAFQSYVAGGGLIKLTTNYDSMTITDGDKTATIVDGVQTGGDLPVNCLGPQNEKGEETTIVFTFEQKYSDGGLTIVPVSGSNDGNDYSTTILSNDEDDGSYISAKTVYDSPIIIERGGSAKISGKKSGKIKVSSTSNNTNGKLYTITAEGDDTGIIVTPSQNGGAVATDNGTAVDVRVSGNNDAVSFDNVDTSSKGAQIATNGSDVTVTDAESGKTLAKGIATDESNEFLKGFVPSAEYKDGLFSDVGNGAWYDDSVELAYQLGIINGNGNGKFDPTGNITVAQAIKMACVVHGTYAGDNGDFTNGDPWYQVYVDYAIKNGIIKAGQFDDYNDYATREVMAAIFANGVSDSALESINTVKSIPDVSAASEYGSSIFMLYRAGVLTGNDSKGTFTPSAFISRAQAAAIITRIAVVSQRRSLTL